ncbi:MAG: hypothetical protein Fur002_06000 [Anaerolineales bacterium]
MVTEAADNAGGRWHWHPYEDPQRHDFAEREITFAEFLEAIPNILLCHSERAKRPKSLLFSTSETLRCPFTSFRASAQGDNF